MAIDKELEDAILRTGGWDTAYERLLAKVGIDMRPANARGERSCNSPFPWSGSDSTPSCNINMYSGLWRDWHAEHVLGMKGGNIVQMCALIEAPVGDDGRPNPSWAKAERALRIEYGVSKPVDLAWLKGCQILATDEACRNAWLGRKPWKQDTLPQLGIGWDPQRQRIVIPVYDRDGDLTNTRLYKVNRTDKNIPKYMWSQPGLQGNYLFPSCAWSEPWIVLVEGEGDVISLRGLGFKACSGTEGSGNPVPEGLWWYGKSVYIMFDKDGPGKKAAAEAAAIMAQGAANVAVVEIPDWEGMPDNADVSNWIMHMMSLGLSEGDIQREIATIIKNATVYSSSASRYDGTALPSTFAQALTSQHLNKRVVFKAHLEAMGSQKYSLPVGVVMTCPSQGYNICKTCVMHTKHRGNAMFKLDPRGPLSLKMIQVTDDQQLGAIKVEQFVPKSCPEPRVSITQSVDIECVMLTSTLDEDRKSSIKERSRREAFIIMRKGDRLEGNADYEFEGFIYAAPGSQKLVFLLDKHKRISSEFDNFAITPDSTGLLAEFVAGEVDPFDHIMDISDDLANSVTGTWQRPDLHAGMLVTWFSLTSFNVFGRLLERGYIESMFLGDTRCGKSSTFKALMEWLSMGVLLDCKEVTPAGVLGAVEMSTLTGERYVVPGMLPRSDMHGPVAFDEFHAGNRFSGTSLMDFLSSTRAEGIVTITKAASARYAARVRKIFMANPGVGKLMSEIGGYGVEIIPRLVHQPEDIARFDFAMAVDQREVPMEVLNPKVPRRLQLPRRSRDAMQALLCWARSRKPDQVEWAPMAEEAVTGVSALMCRKYDAAIPLVEPADQRHRVAKVAVAVAVLCCSASDDWERLVVTKEHVKCASRLFAMWYDKPHMGYDAFSVRSRYENTLGDEKQVEVTLNALFSGAEIACAERFVRFNEYTEKMLAILAPAANTIIIHDALRQLMHLRCVEPSKSGKRDVYTNTRQFMRFLSTYIDKKRSESDSHPTQGGSGNNGNTEEVETV